MTRIDTRPRLRNSGRPPEKSAPGFLKYVRGRSCLVANAGCSERIEAAHVDYAGGKGIGTKVADRYAVPLCSTHHAMQHVMGWAAFERQYFGEAGYALKAAEFLWSRWGGRTKWEKKQEAASA